MGCCFAKPLFTPGPQGWDAKSVWNYLTNGNSNIKRVDMKDISGDALWSFFLKDDTIEATSLFYFDSVSFFIEDISARKFNLSANIYQRFSQTSCKYIFKFKVGQMITNRGRKEYQCREATAVYKKYPEWDSFLTYNLVF
jgi:hypothetical protein